jgi:hypothetical protein
VHSRVDRPAHGFHGLDLVPTYNSVEVLDFSLAAVLSAGGVLPMPPSSSEGNFPGKLLSSSKLDTSQCPLFADDVETRLPCVSCTANLDRRYAKFMIYADGVVGLNVRLSFPPPGSCYCFCRYSNIVGNAVIDVSFLPVLFQLVDYGVDCVFRRIHHLT